MPLFPKLPDRVKPSELTMINPVWIDIEANPKEFVAFPDVTYLWVMRDDGKVIIGVEEPWKYPQAFADSVKGTLEDMRKHYEAQQEYWNAKSIRDGSGGHPTLAAWFSETGEASGHAGFAYIGGELQYDKVGKKWMLNNRSGRFGRRDELVASKITQQELQEELQAAARKIKQCTGLEVTTQLLQ
ncbi:MAG: hypothetical protein JXB05_10335 [Myxococcaceae bacterium]|nr:hypothetical protein [Myxococcaceae bacterium]